MAAAFSSVFTIFLLVAAGFWATRRGLLQAEDGGVLTRIVVVLALPPLMVHNLSANLDRSSLVHAGRGLLLPLLGVVATALVAPLAARLGRVPEGRRGTFSAMFTASNAIFIGIPVNLALFGEGALPYVLLYYTANTTYFWTWGAHGIERDAGRALPMLGWDHLKRILSPPFLGFLAGLALLLLGLKLPAPVASAFKHLGALTTPLSLIFMGITFATITWAELRPTRDLVLLLLGRFVVSPGLMLAAALLLPVPPLMAKVFIVSAGLPAITQSALVARSCEADHRYATVMVSATNLATLVALPLWMLLLGRVFPG